MSELKELSLEELCSLLKNGINGHCSENHEAADRLTALKAENNRLNEFCKEFVFGEDNPQEYESEFAKLKAEVERLKNTAALFRNMDKDVLTITRNFKEHPENWDWSCDCEECRSEV